MKKLIEEYESYEEGTIQSKKAYEKLVTAYNGAGLMPTIPTKCYCARKGNIKIIKKACNG